MYPAHQRQLIEISDTNYGAYVRDAYNANVRNQHFVDGKKKLMILGDSYSQDFYNLIVEANAFSDYTISARYVSSNCQIYFGSYSAADTKKYSENFNCKKSSMSQSIVDQTRQADIVIFAASWRKWSARLLPQTILNMKLRPEQKIFVVGPKQFPFDRKKVSQFLSMNDQELVKFRVSIKGSRVQINDILKEIIDPRSFINLQKSLCGDENSCPAFTETGQLISYDGSHLTKEGAIFISKRLFRHPELSKYISR